MRSSSYADANGVVICEHDTLEFNGDWIKQRTQVIYRSTYAGEYAWAVLINSWLTKTLTLQHFLEHHPEAEIVK